MAVLSACCKGRSATVSLGNIGEPLAAPKDGLVALLSDSQADHDAAAE
jgi:hypothetical protein